MGKQIKENKHEIDQDLALLREITEDRSGTSISNSKKAKKQTKKLEKKIKEQAEN
jgi:hypothetical protein